MSCKSEDKLSRSNNYVKGLDLYYQGAYAQTIEHLSAISEDGDLLGRIARFYKAMAHRVLGVEAIHCCRFKIAEQHFRAAVGGIGQTADLACYLVGAYVRAGMYDRCVAEMEKSAETGGDSVAASCRLAQVQWQAGRRPDAYATLNAALRRFGDEGRLHMQLGLFHSAEERFDEARRSLEQAVAVDPTNAKAHYHLALVAAVQNDLMGAVRSFVRAVGLKPEDMVMTYQLSLAAKAACQSGHHVVVRIPKLKTEITAISAARQLASYIAAEPDLIEAFLALPESDSDGDLFGMLIGLVQMALADRPVYADLHLLCSRAFERLGQIVPATHHARKAVEINGGYIQALLQLGRLCEQAGRAEEAIKNLEAAIDKGADWPDVHCAVGLLMRRCNRPVDGREHLRRAVELNAGYADAAEALAA